MVLAILGEAEVSKLANLEQVVFDVLDAARRTILYQVVHHVERLEDPAVLFGFAAEFGPQVLHDHVVVLPVVRVVCQQLKLRIADRPVLIARGLFQNFLVLRLLKH